jgi:hypothetical protein
MSDQQYLHVSRLERDDQLGVELWRHGSIISSIARHEAALNLAIALTEPNVHVTVHTQVRAYRQKLRPSVDIHRAKDRAKLDATQQ